MFGREEREKKEKVIFLEASDDGSFWLAAQWEEGRPVQESYFRAAPSSTDTMRFGSTSYSLGTLSGRNLCVGGTLVRSLCVAVMDCPGIHIAEVYLRVPRAWTEGRKIMAVPWTDESR